MPFPTEPTLYKRTAVADLQGAWEVFRASLVETLENGGFPGSDRALLHTDQAMCWDTVRNLDAMDDLLLIVRNLCLQGGVPSEVRENLEALTQAMLEVHEARNKGEIP